MILSTIRLILIKLLIVTKHPIMNLITQNRADHGTKKFNVHCLSSLIDRYFVVI
jgi:hypothetical protein